MKIGPSLFQALRAKGRTRVLLVAVFLITLGAFASGLPLAVAANPLAANASLAAAALPGNFTRVTLVTGLNHPVQTRFAPNGDMYIAQQCGAIRLYHNGALVGTPVITIPNTQCDIERGLLGIALDGNFATNGYLYAGYTNTDGHSRLSRFTVVNGVANPNTEKILYKFTVPSAIYHNINDVVWGPDGKLWVEAGDGYTCGSACGTQAQVLTSEDGKLLRFNPDGSVPADNPYATAAKPQSYIWALGFRSPFRMTFMVNGTPMIGDVGVHTPVEDKWQRFNLIQKLSNFGWSSFEYHTPCTTPPQANLSNCPIYEYHNNPVGSNAITGFLQYEGNAYPASYKNVLFYSEYGTQTVHYLTFTDSTYTTVASDTVFDSAAGSTVDLEVGPDDNLYSTAIYNNAVYKYVYTGSGNPTPTPTSSGGTPTATPSGGPLQFSNLHVFDTANAANWSIQQNIQVGAVQYGDRGYTLTSVPASLAGSTWIRTANGSKTYTGNPTVSFSINEPATIYVAIDNRLPKPTWMDATWVNSGMTLTNTEKTPPYPQTLFAHTFPTGMVTLGPDSTNAANGFLMYTVIGVPSGSAPTPTPTTAPGTPTPTPPPAPTPTPMPTATPGGGPVQLSHLVVADTANAAHWSLQTNVQVGTVQYGDRGYTFSSVPAGLVGAAWVRTANTSKAFTGNPTVTFTINQQATVYLALDTRLAKPAWMDASWTPSGLTLTNNEAAGQNTYVVYQKTFAAGPVALGPNDAGNTGVNMYTVIVV